MKDTAAAPHIEGTGDVSHTAVANELGLPTRTRSEHEVHQHAQETAGPARPQDVSTGGLVKQHDTADYDAIDPHTHNVWSDPALIPKEVVEGLANEELFKIVRRFDKQMYHVKACKDGSRRGLYPEREMDLVNAADEEFSPDRLRSNIERLYITFVVGSAGFIKHIQRVRSWNEYNRTIVWCVTYFAFWIPAQVGLLLVGLLIALIVYPPSRPFVFPPAPLSMVSASSGGLQKPKAGNTVGSKDSLTGAAEAHKGEAVENEASNFVNGIATVAMASAIGKSHESDQDQAAKKTPLDKVMPDPVDMTMSTAEGKAKAGGELATAEHNKAKDPVIDAIWKGMRPAMRGIEDFCDNYERLANALSPTHPYPEHLPRLRLAAVLLPIALVTIFVKMQYLARGASFLTGVLFFSQPYMSKAFRWFVTRYPDWMDFLQVQNTLLAGVPSNSQLALTLLRIGEEHDTPLPPPPKYTEAPPERAVTPELEENLPPVNADTAERDLSHDQEYYADSTTDVDPDDGLDDEGKPKKKHRFVNFVKGTAKTGVTAVLGADRVKAQIGSSKSKQRQGVLRRRQYIDGPSMYKCRSDGKKGWLIISTSATTPLISWVRENKLPGTPEFDPKFSIQIDDIAELKKLGGLGWKSKLIVGGVLGMEVIDALSVVTRDGKTTTITALPRRDELFNRLIALSSNRWDSY